MSKIDTTCRRRIAGPVLAGTPQHRVAAMERQRALLPRDGRASPSPGSAGRSCHAGRRGPAARSGQHLFGAPVTLACRIRVFTAAGRRPPAALLSIAAVNTLSVVSRPTERPSSPRPPPIQGNRAGAGRAPQFEAGQSSTLELRGRIAAARLLGMGARIGYERITGRPPSNGHGSLSWSAATPRDDACGIGQAIGCRVGNKEGDRTERYEDGAHHRHHRPGRRLSGRTAARARATRSTAPTGAPARSISGASRSSASRTSEPAPGRIRPDRPRQHRPPASQQAGPTRSTTSRRRASSACPSTSRDHGPDHRHGRAQSARSDPHRQPEDPLLPGIHLRDVRQGAGHPAGRDTPFYPRSPYGVAKLTPTG